MISDLKEQGIIDHDMYGYEDVPISQETTQNDHVDVPDVPDYEEMYKSEKLKAEKYCQS